MSERIGVPTMYRSVRFRSRLEARYAAFFDALKWPWQYEPIDLAGYIPDFLLAFRRPLLVEVKPSTEDFELAKEKIEHSGWDGEAIITCGSVDDSTIGIFGAREPGPDVANPPSWGEARVFFCISCGQ